MYCAVLACWWSKASSGFNFCCLLHLSPSRSAGRFFSGEVRAPSVVSDAESDVENPAVDGAISSVIFPSPDGPTSASSELCTEPLKSHIPKVTSDSFISELVSDRKPAKTCGDAESSSSAVLEEEVVPGPVLSPSDPQWTNVDLEEAQIQHAQLGVVSDSADSCSLSSVATYTLAIEDQYGVEERPLWAWVSGGGCSVDSHSPLSWFSCSLNTCMLYWEMTKLLENLNYHPSGQKFTYIHRNNIQP